MEALALIQINAGAAPAELDRGRPARRREILIVAGGNATQTRHPADGPSMSTGIGGLGIDMPKQPRRFILRDHPLGVSIAAALTVKATALAALYFAFFVPPPDPRPPAERTATAVLGLPDR
jgi:hypothetical protein